MTTNDFDAPEVEVKLTYKATKIYVVKAEDVAQAHKKAYNEFLDTPPHDILNNSYIEDFFVETSVEGPEGSDMLHD